MIISIVTFRLPRRWIVEEAATIFRSTAPRYLGKQRLIRKHYYLVELGEGATAWELGVDPTVPGGGGSAA